MNKKPGLLTFVAEENELYYNAMSIHEGEKNLAYIETDQHTGRPHMVVYDPLSQTDEAIRVRWLDDDTIKITLSTYVADVSDELIRRPWGNTREITFKFDRRES